MWQFLVVMKSASPLSDDNVFLWSGEFEYERYAAYFAMGYAENDPEAIVMLLEKENTMTTRQLSGHEVPSIRDTVQKAVDAHIPLSGISLVRAISEALERREVAMKASWPVVTLEEERNKPTRCTVTVRNVPAFIGYDLTKELTK